MDNALKTELEQIKKDYLKTEQLRQEERKCLVSVINTMNSAVAMHTELIDEYREVKALVNTEKGLALDQIETAVEKLRSRIFKEETQEAFCEKEQQDEFKGRFLKACRIIKRIMVSLLDNFYPTTGELKVQADAIDIHCHEEMTRIDLEAPANDFLSFIAGLKAKISEDFRYINKTFAMLLEHVKELERTLTREFGQNIRLKEIEQFETKVNNEMGSIADSFNIHSTIDEIKRAVVEKLTQIKHIVAARKKEELRIARKAQENIDRLNKKIMQAEKDARVMSKKVDYFQTAATKDGLTGLYNRKAFDMRLKDALKLFHEEDEPVALVIFDVDNFKWINDTLGHVAGDKVLKKVAQCLKETFRQNDFIARYGGDEFAVVIERLSEEMANRKIVSFRENFRKKRFYSHNIGDVDVTVSAGIAKAKEGDTPDAFIQRADINMYESKKKKQW